MPSLETQPASALTQSEVCTVIGVRVDLTTEYDVGCLGAGADARFQNTGLERSAGLSEDIAWMQQEYSLAPVQLSEDGPGRAYSRCCGNLQSH